MRRIAIIAVVLVGIASAAWFGTARAIEGVVGDWLDTRQEEGWLAEYDSLGVGGFPRVFDLRFAGLRLADPETGIVWTLPEMALESAVFRPGHVRATWPDEQALSSSAETLTITTAAMTSELDVRPADRFALDLSETRLSGVAVTSTLGWTMQLPEGRLIMARADGQDATYDVDFAAAQLSLPEPLRGQLDPARLLPDSIETLDYRAEMRFDRPWDIRAIEDRRPQVTAIDLGEMNAVWGGLMLRLAGELEVNEAGVPEGALALRAENWREMVGLAVRAGLIPPQMAGTAEGLLEIVAGFGGDPEVIDAELRFAGGRAFLGPLPIGPAPRLTLP